MEVLGLKPGKPRAVMAGLSEFGGGVLTLLGPVGVIGSMATTRAQWGKPIWVTEGGDDLPVTEIVAATALIAGGPGKYSLDRDFGVRLPGWLAPSGLVAVILTVLYAGVNTPEPPEARGGAAGDA